MTTWVNGESAPLVVKLSDGQTLEVPAYSTVEVPATVRIEKCERVKTPGALDGAPSKKKGAKA